MLAARASRLLRFTLLCRRLHKLAEARAKIEARAKERERFACERAEYEAKLAVREARMAATGKKPSGIARRQAYVFLRRRGRPFDGAPAI